MVNPVDLPYRLGVGVMLFNAQGLVFVGRRIDQAQEAWQMPQGGIDDGETPEDAALRELEEEIGTAKARLIARTKDWVTYDLPPHLVGVAWKGKYRGQRQIWFAAMFEGHDGDIKIDGPHPEFNSWRWSPFADLVPMAVDFKRALYSQVTEEFAELAAKLAHGDRS